MGWCDPAVAAPRVGAPHAAPGLGGGGRDAARREDARASLTLWRGARVGRGMGRAQCLTPLQLLQPRPVALGGREPFHPHGRPLGPGRPLLTYNPARVRGGVAGPRFPWGCAGMGSLASVQLQVQLASTTSGSALSAPLPTASRPPAAQRLSAAQQHLPPLHPPPMRGAAAEGDAGEPGGSVTWSCLSQGMSLTPWGMHLNEVGFGPLTLYARARPWSRSGETGCRAGDPLCHGCWRNPQTSIGDVTTWVWESPT